MPLPDLIDLAKEQGIKLVACQMTVDLLGLKRGRDYGRGRVCRSRSLFSRCFGWECKLIHLIHLLSRREGCKMSLVVLLL